MPASRRRYTRYNGNVEKRLLLILSLLFILVRLLFLQQYTQKNPFYNHPVLDSAFYLQWADAIRAGKEFFSEEYHHPPGYAFFLAGLLSVAAGNLYAVLLAQSLMLALQSVLVFATTKRIAGSAAAWLAFVFFSLCGPLVFYSMKILSETVFTSLLLGAFYFLIKGIQEKRWQDSLISGFLLGGAIEVRGTAIIYFIPALLAVFLRKEEVRKSALALIGGAALLIVPVLLRNVVVSANWTPVASNWGENFYMANNAKAAGSFSEIPNVRANLINQIEDVRAEASRRAGRSLTSAEAQRFWFCEGLRFIRDHPKDWLALEGRKVQRIFSHQEISTMYFYELETRYFQPWLRVLFINTSLLLPLFFIGIAFARGGVETKALFGFLLAHLFLLLIFWPELRFLLPAIPFLTIVAGFVARKTPLKLHIPAAAAGVVLCILLGWTSFPGTGGREAWYTNAASAYYANGEMDPALSMAQSAIKINRNYADAWVNLGAALYAKRQTAEARHAWSVALQLQPGHPVAIRNLNATK